MENILTSLFPTKCYFCGKRTGTICRDCLEKCVRIDQSFCVVCEQPAIRGETHIQCASNDSPFSIFSSYKYEGVVRQCIRTAKYSAKLFYPLKKMTYSGVKLLTTSEISFSGHLVVSIPLSRKKARERGFNQAQLIAEIVAEQLKLHLPKTALKRVISTESQYKETREERFRNLDHAFLADVHQVRGKKILLVDDICTSGATFFEATRALKEAGAIEVSCFSLAKKFLIHRKVL